ncbi:MULTISPECIES: DegT/DnrJ/EryC1/StrS aminotransferase family protein [unclassified Paenibacillus]|uniref:DegT/DnrJ/EryC1/StrS family aminotransferase n=1 Tax=unclassified Paenibacillus TaxID=185978 RepID=UPI0017824A22|nr:MULTISPECIES: aminotransferase class I/II-fold pyridoxal phosphate-dependent enzyme [unclassified Paenibacillus]MBD8840702.1 aminotransferase class I/II-fold pyridoxal phosphate-dependent enzyme [Paenibacillus sp. CFBP 13594]QZN76542.1 aminotransferase class I/II-fold pyridoxal phosphate-dependent enzyme [Paenibacillus sp. DR312]
MSERNRIYLASPHMSGLEQRYINEAFTSNWVAPLGPNVDAFEQELADYVGSAGAVALSSGTAAIHLALVLLDVQAGDIVFCSSLTFIASANPILYQKAKPVFIDSEPDSWNMSPLALERAMKAYAYKGQKPKAVIIVNLYGQSADYDSLKRICDEYEVPIIEDAAESLGATYKGQMSGTIGKFGVYSFNGNKIITTSGGGMLVSDDVQSLNKARFYATQARDIAKHYQHSLIGYNYRLSNVLAGIGRGQLQVLNERIEQKRAIFDRYFRELSDIGTFNFMPEASYGSSTRWLTTAIVRNHKKNDIIESLINHLEKNNIESRPVWKPLHLQPIFEGTDYYCHYDNEDVSKMLFNYGICLPSDTNMGEENQHFVIDQLKEIII